MGRFCLDMGFIQEQEYVERREELKAQLAQLQPIARDELVEAHKLLRDFKQLWNEGNAEDRQRIMKLVLDRVWVYGENMVALVIRPQYLIWVREGLKDREGKDVEPAPLPPFLNDEGIKKGNFRFLESYRCGSDGHPALITIWKLLVTPTSLIAVPFQGCVADYSTTAN